jgi:hypothetical protein
MIEKRKARGADRRRESRYPLASRLSWRKAGNDKRLVGWLSDTSRSSVSFIASRRNQPSFGEMIEMIGPDRHEHALRVTRVAPYDENLSLIACRGVGPVES